VSDGPFAAIAIVVAAFFLGSIPFGLIVGKLFFKSDIRTSGSGNIGAANAARTYGKGAGVAVLLLDAAKGAFAVFLVPIAHAPMELGPVAALAAVVGHCYSPWLKFAGGKGVATFLGTLAAFGWMGPALFGVVWIAVVWRTGFASLASILATAAVAILIIGTNRSEAGVTAMVFALGSLALIVARHRANIGRLRAGTEPKLTFGSPKGPTDSRGKGRALI
jgi:glycerol-3-phosphate acyltransferase PlsY